MSNAIRFTHETPEHLFLLNEFAAPFYKNDRLWQNAMQYIAWSMLNPKGLDKKQAANNRALRDKITAAYDPWKCRYFLTKKGLAANNAVLREDHADVEDKVLRMAVEAKFGQNPMLMVLLLKTEDAKLIFDNKYDDVLGAGADGKGANKLGKALMAYRKKLKSEYDFDSNPLYAFDVCAAICEPIVNGEQE